MIYAPSSPWEGGAARQVLFIIPLYFSTVMETSRGERLNLPDPVHASAFSAQHDCLAFRRIYS